MIRLSLFCCLLSCWTLLTQAQLTDNYENLRLTGNLSKDFTTSTSVKFKRDQQKVSKNNKKSIQKAEERFYESSHFKIGELLLSGKVLVNDPITNYVNKVADELLKDDPTLRKKIRIYTVKSPSVNAFTTNDGIILINWGLLAKLKNEAQLAFILSHELVHYIEEHVIDNFIEGEKIEQGIGVYRRQSEIDRFTARTNYSKELESEADIHGFDIFIKSKYNLEAAIGAFNVLAYAHTPFANEPFDLDFLNIKDYFTLSDSLKLEDISPIEAQEDEDSDTHPALSDRKIKMESLIEKHGNEGRKDYLVSKSMFEQVQEQSRFELSKLFLYKTAYGYGTYHTYLLLQDYPDNKYLNKNIVKAVYGVAKFRNNEDKKKKDKKAKYYDDEDGFDYEEITEDGEDEELSYGNVEQVYHLYKELSNLEITTLALARAYHYLKEYDKEDLEIQKIAEDLVKELVVEHSWNRDSFGKRTQDKDSKKATFDMAFVTDSPLLTKSLSYALKNKSKLRKERRVLSDEAYNDIREEIRDEGYSLGIQKMVAVDPFYLKVDTRNKYALDYLASEEARLDLSKKIKENAKLLDMNVNILNPRQLSAKSSDKLEDIAFLNAWFSERLNYGSIDMVSVDYLRTQELIKKYGTEHFYWSGAAHIKESDVQKDMLRCCYSSLLGPLAIPILPTIIGPSKVTYYYAMLFDLEEEEMLLYDYNITKLKDNPATLNSNIYYNLMQISTKKRQKR